jgi:serine/threonine-protein kinase RIO1
MLKRDLANVNKFFKRQNVEVIPDEELYKKVVAK